MASSAAASGRARERAPKLESHYENILSPYSAAGYMCSGAFAEELDKRSS